MRAPCITGHARDDLVGRGVVCILRLMAFVKRPGKKGPATKKVGARKTRGKKKAPKKTVSKRPSLTAHPAARPVETPSRFVAASHGYLPDMYRSSFYPDPLVDKVRDQLASIVAYLDEGKHSSHALQTRCDAMTDAINELGDAFFDAGSELETVAREDIAATLRKIFATYGVTMDIEHALRKREW